MEKLISFLQPYARAARKGKVDKTSLKYYLEHHQMSIFCLTSIAASTWLYFGFCTFQAKRHPNLDEAVQREASEVRRAKLADWQSMNDHHEKTARMREDLKR